MTNLDLNEKMLSVSKTTDTDIVVYFGGIESKAVQGFIDNCRARKDKKNVMLILSTYGGDPDAAYRMARGLQEIYNTVRLKDRFLVSSDEELGEFAVYLTGPCKSAGTLICLGANRLIMSPNSELGPIDMQLGKQDEVGARSSGLAPIQAVDFLAKRSAQLFKYHFNSLRFEMGFSTKVAADTSMKLTAGLMTPLYEQIEPIRLAEVDRSLRVAREYGVRLQNENLHESALNRLVAQYPSHGFVIDRNEAKEIFKQVDVPVGDLEIIGNLCVQHFSGGLEAEVPLIFFPSALTSMVRTLQRHNSELVSAEQ